MGGVTSRGELIRLGQQSCAFNALTACIVILKGSIADTDYVQDIIDLLQSRADEVYKDIESILDELSEGVA